MLTEQWVKSHLCESSACLEVSADDSVIRLRDTADPEERILTFTPEQWNDFLRGAKVGDFNLADTP